MSEKVPLLDLRPQFEPIRDEIMNAIHRVVESQHFVLGPEVVAFEKDIAAYCGCKFGVGVSSGTDALLLALMAIDVGPGDEVITTPYTFFATAGAIVRLGARPVFVDIEEASYNINPALIEQAITSRTKAILPVHLFGQMANMKAILDIAKRHGLRVIEDAAQAIGADHDGVRAGAAGDLGCLSFFPSKNLGAFGDGGMVTTNEKALADRIRLLRNHGFSPKYHSREVGGNFRLDAIQAAILRVKLKYLEEWTQQRRANAACYSERFGASSAVANSHLSLPGDSVHGRHIYNQFVIRVTKQMVVVNALKTADIGCEVYYPVPMHLQDCFSMLGHHKGQFPVSEMASGASLAIPIFPGLSESQLETVVKAVLAACS